MHGRRSPSTAEQTRPCASRWRRMRPTRCRPSCFRRSAPTSMAIPSTSPASISASRRRSWNSCAVAPGPGGTCSTRSARGTKGGVRHGGSPVEYLADLGFLDSRVLAVHGVQFTGDDLARLRALGTTIVSCPRSNRHVGRRLAAARRVLCDGRVGGVRHRQPGERGRSERVQRAGGGAPDCAARAGIAACSRARRLAARGRSASERSSARSSPASERRSSPCECRPPSPMWKNTWSAESTPVQSSGWTADRTANTELRTPNRETNCEHRRANTEPNPEREHESRSVNDVITIMHELTTYLSFVRFSHSVFALPFALTGALLAWRDHPFSWSQVAGSSSAW